VIICLISDLPFPLTRHGESLAANATGFPAVILPMTPIGREYLRFLGAPHERRFLTAIVASESLLRRARCVENRLEHVE
jgi:hypothetical protein